MFANLWLMYFYRFAHLWEKCLHKCGCLHICGRNVCTNVVVCTFCSFLHISRLHRPRHTITNWPMQRTGKFGGNLAFAGIYTLKFTGTLFWGRCFSFFVSSCSLLFAPCGEIFRRKITINHEKFGNAPRTFSFVDLICCHPYAIIRLNVVSKSLLSVFKVPVRWRSLRFAKNVMLAQNLSTYDNEQPERNALVS